MTGNIIRERSFGKLKDDRDVAVFSIINKAGMVAKVSHGWETLDGQLPSDRAAG